MIVVGFYGVTFVIRVSVHLGLLYICPYFHFQTITWVNINGFSPNLVCALILSRSGLGCLWVNFYQFLTVICLPHDSGVVLSVVGYYGSMYSFWFCFGFFSGARTGSSGEVEYS